MYGLAIVVSLLIAAVIKVIVSLLGRIERKPAPPALALPAAAPAAPVPPEHIAVDRGRGARGDRRPPHRAYRGRAPRRRLAGDGRLAHHTSHAVRSAQRKR